MSLEAPPTGTVVGTAPELAGQVADADGDAASGDFSRVDGRATHKARGTDGDLLSLVVILDTHELQHVQTTARGTMT